MLNNTIEFLSSKCGLVHLLHRTLILPQGGVVVYDRKRGKKAIAIDHSTAVVHILHESMTVIVLYSCYAMDDG